MEQPLLVTAAIIVDGDKVLLIKRANEPFKGVLEFGCGMLCIQEGN